MGMLVKSKLRAFERTFDQSIEDRGQEARGRFLRLFPLAKLTRLTVKKYVIGLGTDSFCALVEPKTVAWAKIQGATSFKFGIYYGRTRSDPARRFRSSDKFGDVTVAFSVVKAALLNLISDGRKKRFAAIDANPLSQMFKAKILSLYFPDKYLNVCSADHINLFSSKLGLPKKQSASELQSLLVEAKLNNAITRNWSNMKFMKFLYDEYLPKRRSTLPQVKRRKVRTHPKVDFEEIVAAWNAKGKRSEKYALKWELDRLIALGYKTPRKYVKDRRKQPSYGYDFLSDAPGQPRYIEVKTARKTSGGYCFHLSETQKFVSKMKSNRARYYFYLVCYESDGKPSELIPERADHLYQNSSLSPEAYLVEFDIGKP